VETKIAFNTKFNLNYVCWTGRSHYNKGEANVPPIREGKLSAFFSFVIQG